MPRSSRSTSRWRGFFIDSGGQTRASAEQLLTDGVADLVAFGRPALATPDLVALMQRELPLNAPDFATFYTPDEKGYIDYPVLAPAAWPGR